MTANWAPHSVSKMTSQQNDWKLGGTLLICAYWAETSQSSIYFLVCEPSNLEEYVMKYLFMFLFLPQDLAI